MDKITHTAEEQKRRTRRLVLIVRVFMTVIFALCIVFGFIAERPDVANYFSVSAFTGFVTIILTFVPSFIANRMSIIVPASVEAAIVIFILLAEFFGEMLKFYDRFWWWDIMLHTSSGVLLGIMGVLVVYSLNFKNGVIYKMHPVTIMLFAFTFALACGAVWELFEFGGDYLLGMNMQKSVYVYSKPGTEEFAAEALAYFNGNVRFFDNLKEGQMGRVFDMGLMDTMEDFIVDTVGAIAAVFLTSTYIRREFKKTAPRD